MEKKVLVLMGSPRKHGNCDRLSDALIRGEGNREGGYVFGYGTDRPGDVDGTPAVEEAYRLGQSLGQAV